MVSEMCVWYCCEMTTDTMSTKELADYLEVAIQTLFRWRQSGYGPAYMRVGPRLIRYKVSDVMDWEENLRAQ